jgi:hypothetical protein
MVRMKVRANTAKRCSTSIVYKPPVPKVVVDCNSVSYGFGGNNNNFLALRNGKYRLKRDDATPPNTRSSANHHRRVFSLNLGVP